MMKPWNSSQRQSEPNQCIRNTN